MRDIIVTNISGDPSRDALLVVGTIDGTQVQAQGWLSATTNHFGANAYEEDGSRKDSANPRVMSPDELLVYAAGLLDAQNPAPPVVLFQAEVPEVVEPTVDDEVEAV